MRLSRLSLHFDRGEVQTAGLQESLYSVESGQSDTIRMTGDRIAEGHLRLAIAQGRLRVEPTLPGVCVHGRGVGGPVEVDWPASIEIAGR